MTNSGFNKKGVIAKRYSLIVKLTSSYSKSNLIYIPFYYLDDQAYYDISSLPPEGVKKENS